MQLRSHFAQPKSLYQRLNQEAQRRRKEAALPQPGTKRQRLIRKARQAEADSDINDWISSPGLRAPL
jgi:hypothetical protein